MMDLTGKNALVTGASRGIGKAIAMKLAGQGANIAIPYLGDPAEAEQTQKEIQALGVKCAMYVCDVSSFEASREVVEKIIEEFGGIDILVNNAGIVRDKYDIRTLITTARDILEEASEGGDDASTLLDSAEQRIFDIRRGKNMQGLQRINEVIIETFDRLDLLNSPDSDQFKSISTGIRDLDETITGLNRSDLILLAARPGMGKTSFALNIANHAAVKEKKRVAFFSLEMTKEQLASRMLSTEGEVGGTKLRTGKLTEDEWVRLIEAGDILSKTHLYFDDTPGITVPEMKAKLRRLKDVDLVIIDYLQLMSGAKRIDNRVQEISEITRNLKIMAKEINVPVITLSQLSRASEQRTEHRPVLSDLRDSGSIEQDADIVLFLYRDSYYNKEAEDQRACKCIVAKNRHGETNDINMIWDGQYTRFTDVEYVHAEQ